MVSNQTPKVAFKDQMREVIPVAEAFAVGESQLRDEAFEQQRLEEEQARLDEQQARLEEQRQLHQERQARFQAEQARLAERQARLQAEQARLEAERRLAALQHGNSSPAANNPGMTPVATNTATEREEETRKSYTKRWILAGAALLLVASAAVGGICGSGNCSGSSGGATNLSSSSDATRAPVQSETISFNMSASPMPMETSTEIPSAITPIPTTLAPIPAPRSQPTLPQPTPRPVPPPTRSPVTPRPTQTPTPRPIASPSPRPVAPPEPQPTSTTSRSESIVSYINSITLSGRTLSYPNGNAFAEQEALNWLIQDDVGTSATDELKLRQRFALATFWFANGPFRDVLEDHSGTWLTSTDECDWESISECVDGEVTRVALWRDGLNGQLPTDLALLTAMTELSLGVNQLTGSIPTEFGLLTALTFLSLAVNQLTGSIPTEFGLLTALAHLGLHNKQLTGTIPTELTQMTALTEFYVYNNNVSGGMPFCDGATRPTRLTRLEADCNEVSCPCCTKCCPNGGFGGIPSVDNPCDA